MSITSLVQTLEPGALIELYELDALSLGGDLVRFHGHDQVEPIIWQGNTYSPWPIRAEGFARTSEKPAMPKLSVGNVNGSITALCLGFQDLVGARIIRRRTLRQFLDAANFASGNPTADPNEEFSPEIWFIERKALETNEIVEFELTSALDIQGVMIPRRQIIANICPSQYRSVECGYTGPPVAKIDDTPTTDLALDRCGKRLRSCRLRFGENGILNFGGFPAAALMCS